MSARTGKSSGRSVSSRRLTCTQLEEHLVRKRQADYERLCFWNNSSTYFKAWTFNTAQYSNWTSKEFYRSRMEDERQKEMKKKKEMLLNERRNKLRNLYEEESAMYEEELKEMKMKKEPFSLEELKAANIEIMLREEEQRRRDRDLKMYHHWRQNQPILRDFESKQHYDFVKKSWLQQMLERKKEREEEERKAMEHIENLRKMQEEQERMQKELEEERKKNEEELKQYLDKQMEIIKCKEEQEQILQREETCTLKAQAELEQMLEERQKLEERRKKKDLRFDALFKYCVAFPLFERNVGNAQFPFSLRSHLMTDNESHPASEPYFLIVTCCASFS
ncbi:UNVERIFIED_CONTAM: hypothetical protein PYX00_009646 [Menopon gallinae]|uniref:Trichoplein keratin filament-binding protein n=1 Tax=Menopon gallinae TaxID=328185 RepID=A0AAW2HBW1_9NEOP